MISFRPAQRSDQALLHSWLQAPHVKPYFHGQGLENTLKDLEKFLSNLESVHQHWISTCDNTSFGYLMTSTIDSELDKDSLFQKWRQGSGAAITLDLLIGEEPYLGKGLGVQMIQEFIQAHCSHVDEIFIDPEKDNTRAIHVYEKVGFRKIDSFIADWHPVPHWLMKLEVKNIK